MTDRELSEALQEIDADGDVTLTYWEADFVESFQKERKANGTSRDWWTDKRRQAALRIIEKYGEPS